ncbi:MAG: AmmeMemoRadiSam system protein B, partial [Elusimicrobiota bacterium]
RQALYAGTWYPDTKRDIEEYLDRGALKKEKTKAIACICPHAGWMYSGKVAGSVYSRINLDEYDSCVIVGPNHTGYGQPVSMFPEGDWQMPLGNISVDGELSAEILKNSEFIRTDTQAHLREHCIEVQLPFIQYFNPGIKIVPIVIMSDNFEIIEDIGRAVGAGIKNLSKMKNRKTLVIASTDMTHYEPHERAKKQDRYAIDMILNLDAEGFFKTVVRMGISMCGAAPAAAVIIASILLGAGHSELVKYATSGDVSGDYDAVVGYAGFVIK